MLASRVRNLRRQRSPPAYIEKSPSLVLALVAALAELRPSTLKLNHSTGCAERPCERAITYTQEVHRARKALQQTMLNQRDSKVTCATSFLTPGASPTSLEGIALRFLSTAIPANPKRTWSLWMIWDAVCRSWAGSSPGNVLVPNGQGSSWTGARATGHRLSLRPLP